MLSRPHNEAHLNPRWTQEVNLDLALVILTGGCLRQVHCRQQPSVHVEVGLVPPETQGQWGILVDAEPCVRLGYQASHGSITGSVVCPLHWPTDTDSKPRPSSLCVCCLVSSRAN